MNDVIPHVFKPHDKTHEEDLAATPDGTSDVIVIGGGGSGLSAAIEASTLGRRVTLLEKNPELGGSTIRSIGSISASGTPHQVRKGIKDNPEDHFEDLGKFVEIYNTRFNDPRNEDNLELRRILVENVNQTFRWLMSIGVVFFGPTPEPPHRRPRMHTVLPNSEAYGYHLGKQARKLGVDIRLNRRVGRLIIDRGRVVGVAATGPDGKIERYRARGGVVIACGDFSASETMKLRFSTPEVARIGPCCNPANTGDGHLMAMELGGRVINSHMALPLVRFVPPKRRKLIARLPPWRIVTRFMELSLDYMPSWMLRPFIMSFLTTVLAASPEILASGAVLINKRGERFCRELEKPVYRLAEQPDQMGYIVFDDKIARKFSGFPHFVSTAPGIAYAYLPDYQRSRPDITFKADTLEGLAAKIGVDAETLKSAIAARNRELGEMGDPGDAVPLDRGPYHALGPVGAYVKGTDGGLAINSRFQVLGENDEPIPGLFGAGLAGQGGVMLEGHGHHLGWAFTSGRFAGRHAAYLANTDPAE